MPRRAYDRNLKQCNRTFVAIYAAILLLIFHAFLVAYINSSFLAQFVPDSSIGPIFIIGSALTVLIFLFVSRVLHLVGNYRLTLGLLLLDFIAVMGMAFTNTFEYAVPLFIVHLISVPLIIFNLDVFLEALIGNNESSTGSKRGLVLTLSSFIGALAPFVSSSLVSLGNDDFTYAYTLSALTLIPIIMILMSSFKTFSDPPYEEIQLFTAIRSFWEQINVRYVFLAHFTLQVFFMFMVVYVPLYLTETIGLSWQEFGIIMFFAQMAYVLCEYPIGLIADRYIGEKEMMSIGFLVIALSVAAFSFISVTTVWIWALVMFISRIGASLAEVTTESYFFKQTKSSDAQIISFFRITRPLAYVVGAALGSLSLLYLPFNLMFVVLAFAMIPAMFFVANITDTK